MIDVESRLITVSIALIEAVHFGARALLVVYSILFGYIVRLSNWRGRGWGILRVPMKTTCLCGAKRKGRGGSQHPVISIFCFQVLNSGFLGSLPRHLLGMNEHFLTIIYG